MSRSKALFYILISFCTGMALYAITPYHPWGFTLLALGLSCISLSFKLQKKEYLSILFLILSSLNLGILRGQSAIHITSPSSIDYYAIEDERDRSNTEKRKPITIIGTVSEEPDIRRDKINYTIQVKSIIIPNALKRSKNFEAGVTGHTLVSTGKYPSYKFGDTLEVSGQLLKPGQFDTFDYAGYLSRYDIYSVMYRPKIRFLRHLQEYKLQIINSKFWARLLLQVKSEFETQLNRTFSSEPTSSFMAGLLLGSRKGIPETLSEDFRITGLTHVIAISGYNITIIVSILMALLRPIGKKPSIILSAFGIIIFTFFVGASAAVVRASIMGLISLLALNSERKGNISLSLLLTATLMIAYNPKILKHDIGFQLSFLATMGLIYLSPLLEPKFKWLPKKLAIRESILLTISAQIMAFPIILLNFQAISIVSPLSNLLITGPIIPFAMFFGFISTLISFISISFAKLIAYPGYLLLQYIVTIIRITARIPYSSIDITWFTRPILYLYFIGLTLILLWTWKRKKIRESRIIHYQLKFQHLILQKIFSQMVSTM